jgi:hypothetical protein
LTDPYDRHGKMGSQLPGGGGVRTGRRTCPSGPLEARLGRVRSGVSGRRRYQDRLTAYRLRTSGP